MNAGFSNLQYLKDRLLLASDAAGNTQDDAVLAIGLQVAGLFESLCDRNFGRVVGDVYEATALRSYALVPRYPLESVASAYIRDTIEDGWVSVDVMNFQPLSGMIYFNSTSSNVSTYGSTLKITYTGGFWWDTTEDNTGTQPNGSTIVPQGLVLCWVQFCKYLWDRSSIENSAKAGFSTELERFIVAKDSNQGGASDLPIFVQSGLAPFRRMTA